MKRDTLRARTDDRLAEYIEKYVSLAGAEKREEVLELFEKMNLLFPNWVIITCPVMHPDLHYASKNCFSVFGYDRERLINNSALEKYFGHVHEEDREDLRACYSFHHDFLEAIPPDEHHGYRGVIRYRFRKANGEYMHLHDERACLHLKGSGNFYFVLFQDISETRPFTGVKIELFKQDESQRKIKEFKPSAHHALLSRREQDLVTLIRQGLSTKEIASRLRISPYTVRNIKSKLFEKYKVGNSIELLNVTV